MVQPVNWSETTPITAENLDKMEKNTISVTEGHTHNGVDSKSLANNCVRAENIAPDVDVSTKNFNANKLQGKTVADIQIDARRMSGAALIVELRTNDPSPPANGQIWLRTDI